VTSDFAAQARRIADDVLWPDAVEVDAADRVPEHHFAALDAAGLTGLVGLPDLPRGAAIMVTQALATGCLATAFMWLQHQGAILGVARGGTAVQARWIGPLSSGAVRAGLATTGLHPPAPMTAKRHGAGWVLTGQAPWVTGWGSVAVLRIAALDGEVVRDFLIDALPEATLVARPVDLVAARASRTAELTLDRHFVAADRELSERPLEQWLMSSETRLNGTGALALGVARRAAGLARSEVLLAEIDSAADVLMSASEDDLSAVRAECSHLALRAADYLALTAGSRSVLRGNDIERLGREARFCLVAGVTPRTRRALLARLDTASAK
jgi:alkylation response protein AidB-like acyl-CoA dehydrogenase